MDLEKEARDTLHRSCIVIIVEIQDTWETYVFLPVPTRLLTESHRIAMKSLLSLTYPRNRQLSACTILCLDHSMTRHQSLFAFPVDRESCRMKKTDLPCPMTGVWMHLQMLENKGKTKTRRRWQRDSEIKKMMTQGTGSIIPVT